MTGLDKIVQQIQSEARTAADETLAAAKAEAEKITAEAREKAQRQCAAIAAQSETDVANAMAAAESAAQLAKRRAILAAKQEIITEMIAQTQKSLYSLPDAQYFELILKMVQKYDRGEAGTIHFNAADIKRFPSDFQEKIHQAAAKLTLSKEARKIDGGFVLVYGGVEENCSFDALFYAAREVLQDKVSQLLFS